LSTSECEKHLESLLEYWTDEDSTFCDALKDTGDAHLIYCDNAIKNYWSCGLTPDVAELVDLDKMPCQNKLGYIMALVRGKLL
jgi:predicted NAD-dependent protein-ADP-ribosyltransferase YbiA (DUF1768 family)